MVVTRFHLMLSTKCISKPVDWEHKSTLYTVQHKGHGLEKQEFPVFNSGSFTLFFFFKLKPLLLNVAEKAGVST